MSVIPLNKQVEKPAREKSIDTLYKLVESNVDRVGGFDQAATTMRIDRGDLRRALDNNGRYLAVDHVMRFGERVSQYSIETAQRLALAIVTPWQMTVSPRVQMTHAEARRRLEAMMRRMPLGEELIRQAYADAEPTFDE